MVGTTKALLTGVAALLLATGTAHAKSYRACVRGEVGEVFGRKQAKRICNPANYVKPPRLGWVCEVDPEIKIYKAPGGAKRRRDAICE